MAIFLAGGGSPEQEAQVWRAAFTGVRRALYWPFAMEDRADEGEPWMTDALDRLAITAQMDTWVSLEDKQTQDLAAYDLLFVGGGSTSALARHVKDHGFDGAVRRFVSRGGTYLGGSAGAILACESIQVAALIDGDPAAAGMPGLGLVMRWTVVPHVDLVPAAKLQTVAKALRTGVLAIPEAAGVHVVGTRLTAIGPDRPFVVTPTGERRGFTV